MTEKMTKQKFDNPKDKLEKQIKKSFLPLSIILFTLLDKTNQNCVKQGIYNKWLGTFLLVVYGVCVPGNTR